MNKNLYELLGIGESATKDQIRSAYKKLAQKNHPDREGGDQEKFTEIKLAYETLYDEEARAHYDKTGQIKNGVNKHQVALGEVANVFIQVLKESVNNMNAQMLAQVNLVSKVRIKIDQQLAAVRGELQQLETSRDKLQVIKKRIRTDNGFLVNIITEETKKIEDALAKGNEHVEILEECIELTRDYDYEVDRPMHIDPSVGSSSYSSSSTNSIWP